jgi:hypothetical protein
MAKFLTSIDLQKNQLVKARIENLSSDPSSPVAGQIYFNTSSNRLRYYSGSAWIELDAAVESISVNNPLTIEVSGTGVTISITEADGTHDGYMTATYAALLDAATDLDTANALVQRDGSGNFSAGTITADLTGNAGTATTLETARNIEISGAVTGNADFDGSAAINISVSQANDSVELGTHTTGDYVESIAVTGNGLSFDAGLDGTGEASTPSIHSNATDANTGSTVVYRDSAGDFAAGMITADLTGNVTGEVSSLANHDTDDLAEGSTNLYFTNTRVQANKLNSLTAPDGDVDLNSHKITNLANPVSAQDAATKAYVDARASGLDVKGSVRVATTATLNLATGLEATDVVDGVTLATGDRVLVKNQSTASQNGIYVVQSSGAAVRAADANGTADTGEVSSGMFTFVEEGTINSDSGWVLTTNGVITLGTTGLTFVQFSGAGQITAGAGLTKDGNTLDAVGTADRITVNADSIDIASTYVGQSTITTLGTIATGVWNGTAVAVAYGGTGATTAADARTNLGAITKYAATITGTGAATSFTVTHNFNTKDVTVSVRDTLSGLDDIVYPDVRMTSVNTVSIVFDQAPAGGMTPQTYRVVVTG